MTVIIIFILTWSQSEYYGYFSAAEFHCHTQPTSSRLCLLSTAVSRIQPYRSKLLTYEEKALNQFDSLRTTRLFARNVVDIAAGRAIRPVVVCGHAFSVAAILTQGRQQDRTTIDERRRAMSCQKPPAAAATGRPRYLALSVLLPWAHVLPPP